MADPRVEAAKKDFRVFLFIIWKFLGLPDPTPIQYDIAYHLQHGGKRIIISAFRGIGKSWITSAYVLWLLWRNPQLKIMVVSASKERADQFSTFTRRLLSEVPLLQHLAPRDGQRDSKISFDVALARTDHSPSVKSVGITGQLTGSRADVIIPDDIEVPNNSMTQTAREQLLERVKEFEAILKPLQSSRILYLGTPQSEMSIYNELHERGYEKRIWPVRYPNEAQINAYGGQLAPFVLDKVLNDMNLVGRSTEPTRFDEQTLAEKEAIYGKAGFALQFMLDTSLSDVDKYPLKVSDLVVMPCRTDQAPIDLSYGRGKEHQLEDLPNLALANDHFHKPFWVAPERQPYQGTVMVIDPSGRGHDETSYAVTSYLNGFVFVKAVGGFRGGYTPETLNKLAQTAKRWKVNEVATEQNFGDGMFDQLLTPVLNKVYPCALNQFNEGKGFRYHTQKEVRIIDTLEPVMMQHRLIIDPGVIEEDYRSIEALDGAGKQAYSLIYQMTRITKERQSLLKDDRIDVLHMAVSYWTERMNVEASRMAERTRNDLLKQELRKFTESVFGGQKERSGWRF